MQPHCISTLWNNAHPDTINSCVYNTQFQLHCSLLLVRRHQCKTVTCTTVQSLNLLINYVDYCRRLRYEHLSEPKGEEQFEVNIWGSGSEQKENLTQKTTCVCKTILSKPR